MISRRNIFFCVLLICASVNAAPKKLPNAPRATKAQCNIRDLERFDCYPGIGGSQQSCEARGCCWAPPSGRRTFVNEPYCFYPAGYGGYRYLNVTDTRRGIEAFLTRTFNSPFPEDVLLLKMVVTYEDDNRLRIKITDAEHPRFESPFPEIHKSSVGLRNPAYKVVIDKQRLGFQVLRKADDTVLFDTMDLGGFIYANQYLQISARLPSNKIYGLGEHTTRLLQSTNWNKIVLWNSDQMPVWDVSIFMFNKI